MKTFVDAKAERLLDIFPPIVKQVNVSFVSDPSIIFGWHLHPGTDDYYVVLKGSFEFGVVERVGLISRNDKINFYVARGGMESEIIYVPGNMWHGFRALEKDSILLYGMTNKYEDMEVSAQKISFFDSKWSKHV